MTKKLDLRLNETWFEYVGTKFLYAYPMNRGDYNLYQGWEIPENENPTDAGYLVEYIDGGKPNHPEHRGYISWSPKDVFEKAYKKRDGVFNFSAALDVLKTGRKVARKGWNGKDQYVVAQAQPTTTEASKIWNPHNKAHAEKIGGQIDVAPYCTLKTAQDTLAMGWTPSTGDLFAEDWVVVS